jgi:hypothetical protein
LDKAAPIVNPVDGRITPYFQRFWQNLTITSVDGANQNTDIAALQSSITTINGQITTINSTLTGKAPLASPTFTGTPAAPTAAGGTNTTQLATTAFVQGELAAKAPLASPVFTGNPTAPTPTAGDNDASIATTAFVTTHAVARSTFNTWTAATGTLERTTFATYTAPTASATYDQTEMQAVMDAMQDVSRRLAAVVTDLKT